MSGTDGANGAMPQSSILDSLCHRMEERLKFEVRAFRAAKSNADLSISTTLCTHHALVFPARLRGKLWLRGVWSSEEMPSCGLWLVACGLWLVACG
eukprot:867406-Rhodomonas_salina.1